MATPGEKAKRSKLTSRLDALTQGNPSLRRALQQIHARAADGSLQPLAALRPAEWLDLVYEHGTPAGTTPAAYADALAASVAKPKEPPRRAS